MPQSWPVESYLQTKKGEKKRMKEIQNHYLTTFSPSKALVVISSGKIITTSLTVADVSGKPHKNVMRSIESLDCSPEFFKLNFEPKIYQVKKGNGAGYLSNEAMYEMTRDGFVFLCMGFTGAKAAAFKEKYIAEFNRMESFLNGPKTKPYLPVGKILQDVARHYRAAISISKNSGLRGNQAILRANRVTSQETGRDCLELVGLKALPVPENEPDYVPSDLGRKLGGQSGRAVNALLEKAGLQQSFRSHSGKIQWEPTEKGKAFAVLKETERKHCPGTCRQVFWRESVLNCLALAEA